MSRAIFTDDDVTDPSNIPQIRSCCAVQTKRIVASLFLEDFLAALYVDFLLHSTELRKQVYFTLLGPRDGHAHVQHFKVHVGAECMEDYGE